MNSFFKNYNVVVFFKDGTCLIDPIIRMTCQCKYFVILELKDDKAVVEKEITLKVFAKGNKKEGTKTNLVLEGSYVD